MSHSNILVQAQFISMVDPLYIPFLGVLYIKIYGIIMHPLVKCIIQSLCISMSPFFEMSGSAVVGSFQMYRMVKKNRYFC